jgi:hypothetical protein
MSLLHTSVPYRRDAPPPLRVPVLLPLVQVMVETDGHLTITVDREEYESEPIERGDLGRVVDEFTSRLGAPVRVEVHEPDGSMFTDIVTPRQVEPDLSKQDVPRAEACSRFEIAGDGFAPNEQVAIAVVVAHQVASKEGTARLRLPPALIAEHSGIVVLLGETSGTIAMYGGAA